jgi:hypothetical protein
MSKKLFFLCLVIGLSAVGQTFAAPFTPGNIAVCRVGDGAAALSTAATAVFVDEFTPAGVLVQSIALPTSVSGANQALTVSGSGTTDCAMTRSGDGRYLVLTGYNAAVGTTSVATTTSAAVSRVIGRIDSNGAADTSTTTTSFSANAIRSAVSSNGIDFWFGGASTGVVYNQLGTSGAGTLISSTITNNRVLNIFNNQLYAAHASGTTLPRIGTIGTGLPTTLASFTGLPGYIINAGSNYGFYLTDLDTGVAGLDTMYVADDGASAGSTGGGIKKFSLVAGSWTYNGTFPAVVGPPAIPATTFRGLTGRTVGTTVTLYAQRSSIDQNDRCDGLQCGSDSESDRIIGFCNKYGVSRSCHRTLRSRHIGIFKHGLQCRQNRTGDNYRSASEYLRYTCFYFLSNNNCTNKSGSF